MPLTWAEIVRWTRVDGFRLCHTMHHPALACLTNPAEVHREVAECREMLEQQLGHLCVRSPILLEGLSTLVKRHYEQCKRAGYTGPLQQFMVRILHRAIPFSSSAFW